MFYINGNTVRVDANGHTSASEVLPPGHYQVAFDRKDNMFFLTQMPMFTLPSKIYGDSIAFGSKIITTYLDRDKNTGVLLVGNKGSGKTLTSKYVCKRLIEEYGIPVISVTTAYSGDMFTAFLQSITQPCVILWDEFEKMYKKHAGNNSEAPSQEDLLTLLDGVLESNKLHLLTANDSTEVSTYLVNRPGRIYYRREYGAIPKEVVREYCEDNLDNQDYTESIVRIASAYRKMFNFDTLATICVECNKLKLHPYEAVQDLNVLVPSMFARDYTHNLSVKVGGVTTVVKGKFENPAFNGNGVDVYLENGIIKKKDSPRFLYDEDDEDYTVKVVMDDFTDFDEPNNAYIFDVDGVTFIFAEDHNSVTEKSKTLIVA
jgi:hypothetical protein